MKKIIAICIALATLLAVLSLTALAAGEPTFYAEKASGCVGSTVEVRFLIKNNAAPGIVGAELKGTYDATKLEFVSAANGSVMSSPICNTKDGTIYYSWDDSLTTGITGDGVMCTLTFKILDTCKIGDVIDIEITQFKTHNTDLENVSFEVSGSTVSVTDHTWTDPSYKWSSDYSTCTATRKQSCGCGGKETETVNSAKKEEDSQTVYTVSFENPAFATQTKKVAKGPIQVTFRLIGATLSKNGVDLSKGPSDSEYVTWIPTTEYTLEIGSSVYDLIKKALDAEGLEYTMTTTYLSSIHAPDVLDGYELAEFTNGARSGWMFTVNGKHGSLSIGDQELKDGDVVIVHYINDYLYEENEYPWVGVPDVKPTKPVKPDPGPTEPPEPTNPPEPTDPTQPTDPIEPTNPTDPTESTAPSKPSEPDPTQPAGPSEDPTVVADGCTCWVCNLWWLLFLLGIVVNTLITWGIVASMKKRSASPEENENREAPETENSEE